MIYFISFHLSYIDQLSHWCTQLYLIFLVPSYCSTLGRNYSVTFPIRLEVETVIFSPLYIYVHLWVFLLEKQIEVEMPGHQHFKYQNIFPNCPSESFTSYIPIRSVSECPLSYGVWTFKSFDCMLLNDLSPT